MSTVEHLRATLAGNRFMPAPPPDLIHCGDGDFRAIGLEFLDHLAGLAGLAPDARMLDLGCGVGRIALPLTQYLSAAGTYDGIDVMPSSIRWCADTITPVGLAATELITNALKYGAGTIRVRVRRVAVGVELQVEDEGAGFEPGFEPARGRGLGMRLLIAMAKGDPAGAIRLDAAVPSRITVTLTMG